MDSDRGIPAGEFEVNLRSEEGGREREGPRVCLSRLRHLGIELRDDFSPARERVSSLLATFLNKFPYRLQRLRVLAEVLRQPLDPSDRGGLNVMLYSLRIFVGNVVRHPYHGEQLRDHFVSPYHGAGDILAVLGEVHPAIPLVPEIPLRRQLTYHV